MRDAFGVDREISKVYEEIRPASARDKKRLKIHKPYEKISAGQLMRVKDDNGNEYLQVRNISKGLPSALRGAKGEKMMNRVFDSKAGSKMGRKLEAKYGKKPNLSRKKTRKVASFIERGMGTSNTYLLSRIARNEAGKAKRPKRMAMGQGLRDWERSAGFKP